MNHIEEKMSDMCLERPVDCSGLLGLPALGLVFNLLNHVVDDMAMLVLWAEHHDLCVGGDLYVVPGGPVKEIISLNRLL